MSRFFSNKYRSLEPYTPGEQPQNRRYVKLNTNESPYPPSPKAIARAAEEAKRLQLYSDPECKALTECAARHFGLSEQEFLFTNGSDEILNFAFMAFCDQDHPAVFPEITYGFYPVFAELNGVPYRTVPLREDFTLDPEDYMGRKETVFLANPNAPTGIALSRDTVEAIVKGNPDSVVVIDEAYVDFGAESALPLIRKYDNLLVTQTFSKSRSLAGGRLGFGAACASLIADLNTVKYSTNPYNVNRMTMAAGIGALEDDAYFQENCRAIRETRESTLAALRQMGFIATDSVANFIFAKHPQLDGKELYLWLKDRGILVRHFDRPALRDYNRITVGTPEEMQILTDAIKQRLEELK